MVFLQNSLRSLAGNFGAEFDPEQGIRIREQGMALSRKSQPARLCGARARLAAAALAGAAAASLDR